MTATCPKCGKVLKVKDEFAGKLLKCPQCQSAFRADASGTARAVAQTGGPKAGAAAAKGKPGPRGKQVAKAGMAINWGPIALWGGLALIPIGVMIFIFGPMKVKRHFDANSEKAYDDIKDVVELALKCEASQSGAWDPRKGTGIPSVVDMNFHPDFLAMSTPPTVHFVGTTSNGKFEGDYTWDGGEIVATLAIGGVTLGGVHIDAEGVTMPGGQTDKRPAGLPTRMPGNVEHKLTGRVTGTSPTCEIDGKKGQIYMPPAVDEDGNRVKD